MSERNSISEVNAVAPRVDYEAMAKRRFQDPAPFLEGDWWIIRPRIDEFKDGKIGRSRPRWQVAPATTKEREAKRIAAEMLRPINQGLESIGGAIPFGKYVETTYEDTVLPLLASSVQKTYRLALRKHLTPIFKNVALRDLNVITLQKYFSQMKHSHSVACKVRDVLASVLTSALRFGIINKNPLPAVRLLAPKTGKRSKPYITPQQFDALVNLMAEPYATMVYVCVFAGLRVSELIGLKWEDVHDEALTIDERFCRGDWAAPKTSGSSATIGVDPKVIQRIHDMKGTEVTINWGGKGAKKSFKLVRADGPADLVFQSLTSGSPMSDHNILSRHMKPAGEKIGIGWVNWQALRRSYITWMFQAGADPKSVQAQARHARLSTTSDIYAQFVSENQRRAVAQLSAMVDKTVARDE